MCNKKILQIQNKYLLFSIDLSTFGKILCFLNYHNGLISGSHIYYIGSFSDSNIFNIGSFNGQNTYYILLLTIS